MLDNIQSLTAVADIFSRNAVIHTQPGDIWLAAQKDGPLWPVVICDEEMFQSLSKDGRRPTNARKPNGQWRKDYRPGGILEDQVAFPAMKIGTMKLCWISWNRLKPLDAQEACSDMYCIIDEGLKSAYAEAYERYGLDDLNYWKDKILAKQLEKASRPKRKISAMGFVYPPDIDLPPLSEDGIEDEEDEGLFVENEDDISRDKKKESRKRQRFSDRIMPRSPTYQGIMDDNAYFPSGEPSNAAPKDDGMINPADFVTVYVGNPHQKFLIKDSEIEQSEVLAKSVSRDPNFGPYVMLPSLVNINPDHFRHVADFLNRGELRCWKANQFATIDILAGKMRILGLASKCREGIRGLLSAPSKDVLNGIRKYLAEEAQSELTANFRKTLSSHLANNFWTYVHLDVNVLEAVLRVNKEFTKDVFEELAFLKWF